MLAEIKAKSQVTIPVSVVKALHLKQGDKLEVTEKNGVIELTPVSIYPKGEVEELLSVVAESRVEYKSGKLKKYDSPKEALEDILGEDYVQDHLQ